MVCTGNPVPSLPWEFIVLSLEWFSCVEVNTVYPKCLNFLTSLIFVAAPPWQDQCSMISWKSVAAFPKASFPAHPVSVTGNAAFVPFVNTFL